MFICDKIQLMKHQYCVQDYHIQEIFREANKRNVDILFLIEQHQKPLHSHKWIKYAKDLTTKLVLVKEIQCYHQNSETRIPFLFASKNNQEYSIIKKISTYLHKQHIPFLNDEAFEYFKRINLQVWYMDDDGIKDFFRNNIIGNKPCIPLNPSEIGFFELFNNHSDVTTYETFFDSFSNNLSEFEVNWEVHSIPEKRKLFSNMPLDYSDLTDAEKIRLKKEVEWLENNQHDKVFWLAHKLSQECNSSIGFKGDFDRFFISYKLGLINHIPTNYFDISSDEYPNYIFESDWFNKNNVCARMENLLAEINNQFKFPLVRDEILFSSVLNFFNKKTNELDIETMVYYKDMYDDKSKIEKENFFEDMKLYFLLNPEAESAFKHALYFTDKNIYKNQHQSSEVVLIDIGEFELSGNYINLDTEELKEYFYPIISLNLTKINP